MCKIYKPKKYLFEDNNKYIEEIEKKLKDENQFSGVSQSLTIKKSISLLEEYKNQNKKIYNFVILYRPDIILYENMYLKNYNVFNNIYVNAHPDCNGDFHFVMNYENAILFKYLYDSIEKGNEHKMHFWIKNYIVNYMEKNLLMDNIVPPNDQDVLRKAVDPMRANQYKSKILFI